MATYTAQQLGIRAPAGGFRELGWYSGRQFVGGTFGEVNQIHPRSPQQGAGQPVSAEVRAQSAAQQGVSPQQFDEYLRKQGATPQQSPPQGTVTQQLPQQLPQASAPAFSAPRSPVAGMSEDEIINKYYNTPEAQRLQEERAKTEAERDRAISEIQNNPWFSEATTVGRISQINADAERKLTRVNNELARIQADAQIRYRIADDLYTKNRQAYQDTLAQFNNLLQLGAFNNASGQDIAQWASATGISTSAIQSMAKTQRTKNLKVDTYEDNTGVYTIAFDQEGNIVNKQFIGAGKPRGEKPPTRADYVEALKRDARAGATLSQIYSIYLGYLDANEILNLYNASSRYGPAKESYEQLEKYGVVAPKSAPQSSRSRSYENLFGK
jgi:hypothetical protein